MGLLLSIARKFNEYAIKHQQRYVFSDEDYTTKAIASGGSFNSNAYEVKKLRMLVLNGITEALTDANINLIGVYGSDYTGRATLVEKVSRIAKRDNLFDVVVTATLEDKPDLKWIQEELSRMLGLKFDKEKNVAERACCLYDKIKEQHTILIVLRDIWKRLDLGK